MNQALRSSPIAEMVASYTDIHRTTEGKQATERRARRKCWVFRYPGSPADDKLSFQYEAPREEVIEASIGPDGKPIPTAPAIHNYYGREIVITPTLEEREIVVARTQARHPRYEPSLDDVRLPPAFTNGGWH